MNGRLKKVIASAGVVAASFGMAVIIPGTPNAFAGPECNHSDHDHYHFPYAHRDDWLWWYGQYDHYETFYNWDHDYFQSTGDCT